MPEWFTRRPFLNGKLVHHFETGVPVKKTNNKQTNMNEY